MDWNYGHLRFPEDRKSYQDVFCVWIIKVAPGMKIHLNVTVLKLDGADSCNDEFLKVGYIKKFHFYLNHLVHTHYQQFFLSASVVTHPRSAPVVTRPQSAPVVTRPRSAPVVTRPRSTPALLLSPARSPLPLSPTRAPLPLSPARGPHLLSPACIVYTSFI